MKLYLVVAIAVSLVGVPVFFIASGPGVVQAHRNCFREGQNTRLVFSTIAPCRPRIIAENVLVPDYWGVKSFSAKFFARFSSPSGIAIEFKIACKSSSSSSSSSSSMPYELSFGSFSATWTRGSETIVFFDKKRVPTLNADHEDCSLVAIPMNQTNNQPILDIEEWSLELVPEWHWSNWFPRTLTDEYYRALAVSGLRLGGYSTRSAKYAWYGLFLQDDEENGEGKDPSRGAKYASYLKMRRIALAVQETEDDKAELMKNMTSSE